MGGLWGRGLAAKNCREVRILSGAFDRPLLVGSALFSSRSLIGAQSARRVPIGQFFVASILKLELTKFHLVTSPSQAIDGIFVVSRSHPVLQ